MRYESRIRGIGGLAIKLRRIPGAVIEAAAGASFAEGTQAMSQMLPLVPVDGGTLKSSGHVQLPVTEGLKTSVKLGFGGPAGTGKNNKGVGYARFVHDNERVFGTSPGGGSRSEADNPRRFRRFRGKPRARQFVGQSHYMSKVMDQRRQGFAQRFAGKMVARLRAAIRA